jgi:Mg/Co/Ni transporter MgtE
MIDLAGITVMSATASGLWAHKNPADLTEHLNEMPIDGARRVVDSLPIREAIEVLDQSMLRRGGELLMALPSEKAALLVVGMAIDRLADLIRQSKPAVREALLLLIPSRPAAAHSAPRVA